MEFLNYPFMQRALLAGIIIAIVTPLMGLFLILRRLSMIGDTLSHMSLLGVAIGMLSGLNITLTALVTTVTAALGIEQLRKKYSGYSELAIAIMMSTGISLAIFLVSLQSGNLSNLSNYLFGSIIAVSQRDLYMIMGIGLLILGVVAWFFQELFYSTLDPDGARLSGVNVELVNFLFILMIALTITISLRIVGVLLISSLMILPVAASLKIAKNFQQATYLAIGYSLTATLGGLIISFNLDTAPGGTIVLSSVLLLLITLAFSGKVGEKLE